MPILKIKINSYYSDEIQILINSFKHIFKKVSVVSLPIKTKKYCVLTSPHVNKDSREHFSISHFKKILYLNINSISNIKKLLKLKIPSNISISVSATKI